MARTPRRALHLCLPSGRPRVPEQLSPGRGTHRRSPYLAAPFIAQPVSGSENCLHSGAVWNTGENLWGAGKEKMSVLEDLIADKQVQSQDYETNHSAEDEVDHADDDIHGP